MADRTSHLHWNGGGDQFQVIASLVLNQLILVIQDILKQ